MYGYIQNVMKKHWQSHIKILTDGKQKKNEDSRKKIRRYTKKCIWIDWLRSVWIGMELNGSKCNGMNWNKLNLLKRSVLHRAELDWFELETKDRKLYIERKKERTPLTFTAAALPWTKLVWHVFITTNRMRCVGYYIACRSGASAFVSLWNCYVNSTLEIEYFNKTY